MLKNKQKLKNVIFIISIIIISLVIFVYQTQKKGFHEDEVYTITSSVNPYNGLMLAYSQKGSQEEIFEKYIYDDNIITEINNVINYFKNKDVYDKEMHEIDVMHSLPIWRTNEEVKEYVSLKQENYLNFRSLYVNQLKDTHPPFFYTLVHFSTMLFGGEFTKYSVFVVNIIAFIVSCFVLKRTLKILNKEDLTIPTLIFYGLSMGTITMVLYQRMYMVLTLFILLYFYYSIQFYKNDFKLTKKLNFKLGITTVLGFLTQYYFAIYAFLILAIMIAKMVKDKQYKTIIKYVGLHILYAIIGIILFVPSIYHLMYSDRGIANLTNMDYINHLVKYIKHLLFAFTVKDNMILFIAILLAILGGIIYSIKSKKEAFITIITFLPTFIYFLLVAKITSYQEFRYIMIVMPFVVLTMMFILDNLIKIKYKNICLIIISILFVLSGFICSKPKFLFEEYKDSLQIAEENKDKPYVFVYDNMFNHIQSVPEMMIYKKSIVINYNSGELICIFDSEELENEDSYILCLKTYMDNNKIIEEIKENSDFKNVTQIHFGPEASTEVISNNLYLVTK